MLLRVIDQFSTCGAIIRSRRTRLSTKTMEALLFKMENND